MGASETAATIRQALKRSGLGREAVSVRSEQWTTGGSVRVRVRRAAVPLERVQAICGQYERVDRCEVSGEILAGGNLFVSVDYDGSALAGLGSCVQRQLEDGRRKFGRLTVHDGDRFSREVFEEDAEGVGRHVGVLPTRDGGQLAKMLATRGLLSVLEESWT